MDLDKVQKGKAISAENAKKLRTKGNIVFVTSGFAKAN